MTLPQYIDRLKPEYGMYKLPFVPLPFWVDFLSTMLCSHHLQLADP